MDKVWHPKGDPRKVYAHAADKIGEAAFVAWETQSLCLCGCGNVTRPYSVNRGGKYVGARCFWIDRHYFDSLKRFGLFTTKKLPPKSPQHRRALADARRRSIREDFIDPTAISDLVLTHIREQGKPIKTWLREQGLPVAHMQEIISGRGPKKVHPRTAIRLLEAIGEKPHPSLVAYCAKHNTAGKMAA